MTERAPTYEEIVAYADSEGLIGRIDTVKFYDFYAKQNFMYRGYIMDWKKKMHEWADRQKGAVKQSAKEYNALNKVTPKKILLFGKYVSDKEYFNWLAKEVETWKKNPKVAVA